MKIDKILRISLTGIVIAGSCWWGWQWWHQQQILKEIIKRLTAQRRVAQVLVTGVNFDETTKRNYTTIKLVEFDTQGNPLPPQYFTFAGNIIQFQSLVVRFDDQWVKKADALRGKSIYLFLKAFSLDGKNTQEFVITPVGSVPQGYQVNKKVTAFEREFWQDFWRLVLDPKFAGQKGVRNAQIEAPGSIFLPGYLYTLSIENRGGLVIQANPLPAILVDQIKIQKGS